MSAVTWLHLSDWHQKGPDFDRKVVRDALIADISGRTQIDPKLSQVDFVVFSGDAAFSGAKVELESARREFFDPVLAAVGLKPDKLFFVPGNHDLDRDWVAEMLPQKLQTPLENHEAIKYWLTDDGRRKRALEPFNAYQEFVSIYTGQENPAYASTRTLQIDGKTVALLGLNSAWMCSRHKDNKGEVDDERQLVIGEPQIHDSLGQIAGADLRIIIVHHPLDWLIAFDRSRAGERLEHSAHFILTGHQHLPDLRQSKGPRGECILIPAGASYDRRTPSDPRYANAYNFVRLDSVTGKGVVYFRRWSDRPPQWIEDTETSPAGKYGFSLPKELRERRQARRAFVPDAQRRKAERIAQAAARYRELLLKSCDIIDLANLPEQDRNLAHRQLELRRLYVPLRVVVETKAAADGNRIWDALEARRASAQRGTVTKEEISGFQKASPGERLIESRRLVILGDPGAGKSTLARWIATAYLLRLKSDPDWKDLPDVRTLPSMDWLPILVRCRDLDKTARQGAFADILERMLRQAELAPDEVADVREHLLEEIRAGRALLVLDGLDEIADTAGRARFCTQIEKIATAHPDLPIIATSRIVGYREMGRKLARDFEHVTLADLAPNEKDEFARRWTVLTERPERRRAAAQELIADIHSSDRIERLTGNPMLLTTMALVKRTVGKLPQRRADLYWEAVQVLLNWRSEVDTPIDHLEAIPQLEYLAYAMCDRGVQRLPEDEVLDHLARMRLDFPKLHAVQQRSPAEFLRVLESRTAILIQAGNTRQKGRVVAVYEFRHLTFQEYLAARALVDGCFPGRNPQKSVAQDVAPLAGRTNAKSDKEEAAGITVVESWREALRLCSSICHNDDVDEVLKAILRTRPGEPTSTVGARVLEAALCLVDEPNASEELGKEILDAMAELIAGYGRTAFTRTYEVVEGLAKTRWKQTFADCLLNEFSRQSPMNRQYAGSSLVNLVMTEELKYEVSFPSWLERCEQDLRESEEVATKAALVLMDAAFLGIARITPGITSALLDCLGGSAPMSHAAAWALAWFCDQGHGDRRWRPTSVEMTRILANVKRLTADPEMVRWLIRIVCAAKSKAAIEPVTYWLRTSTHARLRSAAAHGLGMIGSDRAVMTLVTCLKDREPAVRRSVADALGEIGNDQAVEALTAHLSDADRSTRDAAAAALGKIGGNSALEALIRNLETADSDLRRSVARALGTIRSGRAVKGLIARLVDVDASVQRSAAMALGEIGGDQATQALIARLGETDGRIRHPVIDALGEIGGNNSMHALIAQLNDADADTRRHAAKALGKVRSDGAVQALIACLEDRSAPVRESVAAALGIIESDRAVTALIAHIDDNDTDVVCMVSWALGRIGDDRAIEVLTVQLRHKHEDIRRSAVRGIAQRLDQIDRQLLSRDLNEAKPFIDPDEPVTSARIEGAANRLGLSVEDVRSRYESLASRLGLQLAG